MRKLFRSLLRSAAGLGLLSDKMVERYYLRTGSTFGARVSFVFLGEASEYQEDYEAWAFWEAQYARRGYETLPLEDFIRHGGYGLPLGPVGRKRPPGRPVVLHALNCYDIRSERFLSDPRIALAGLRISEIRLRPYFGTNRVDGFRN